MKTTSVWNVSTATMEIGAPSYVDSVKGVHVSNRTGDVQRHASRDTLEKTVKPSTEQVNEQFALVSFIRFSFLKQHMFSRGFSTVYHATNKT